MVRSVGKIKCFPSFFAKFDVRCGREENKIIAMDKVSNVVLDIDLTQPTELCCTGSPKMTKVLSRKGSIRMDKHNGEEQKADDASKKLVIKVVPSLPEQQLKQPPVPFKSFQAVQFAPNSPVFQDMGEGRHKRSNRLTIHPRKILLFFATMSSIGTMILIYFTLAINRKNGAYLRS
ncbi:hypothetical protein OPV22_018791 [Ensete ventricosum]|uniref:Uncharacterized protein n=1 Tax=Ensete ventricosum TaxID=4639 RepID=A0AAV8PJG4_ENSVE|nr:hypothetical protein OPV22_018791 [Ensete ventricosum]